MAAGAADTFVIIEGVRRAVSAHLLGIPALPAEETDALGGRTLRSFDVPVASLLSPKAAVEVRTDREKDRWFGVLELMRRSPGTMPPLRVRRGARGTPIAAVSFDSGFRP